MGTNTATANVRGGLFGDAAGLTQLVSICGREGRRTYAAHELGTKIGFPLRAIMNATAGVAPGGVATYVFPTIEPNVELGGKRTILQTALINRATTAADVTEYKNDILKWSQRSTFGANPVANKDGNPLGTR
jgi:hypothetical protein